MKDTWRRSVVLLTSCVLVLVGGCEGFGQGAKSDKLSRPTALTIINKNLDRSHIHRIDMQVLLWAKVYDGEYEQSRAKRGVYPPGGY